jgi:hypothetical protein
MPVYRTDATYSATSFYSRITGYLNLIAMTGKIELSDLCPESNPYNSERPNRYDTGAHRDVLLVRGGKPLLALLVIHNPGSARVALGGYIGAEAAYAGAVSPAALAGRDLNDVKNSITMAMEGLPDAGDESEKEDETAFSESEWRILVRVPGQPNKLFKGGPFDIPTLEEAFVYISQQIVAAVGSAPAP